MLFGTKSFVYCIVFRSPRKFNVALVTLKAEGATGELAGTEALALGARDLVPGVTTTLAAIDSELTCPWP